MTIRRFLNQIVVIAATCESPVMKLTPDQEKKAVEKLNQLWKDPKACGVCNSNQWDLSGMIFELREFHGGDMMIGGNSAIAPLLSAVCRTCGNTIFFNAMKLGLVGLNGK